MIDDVTTSAKVSKHVQAYKLNEIGREALKRMLTPELAFDIGDLGPKDRASLILSVTVAGHPEVEGLLTITLDVPAAMLEAIA